jgi:hypothetical protein
MMNYKGVWKGTVQSQKVPQATGETHKKCEIGSQPEYNSKERCLKYNAGMPDDITIFIPCTRHPTCSLKPTGTFLTLGCSPPTHPHVRIYTYIFFAKYLLSDKLAHMDR